LLHLGSQTVDDIVLDSRNLLKNQRFKGIQGLRLLIGTTFQYIDLGNSYEICFKVSTITGSGKEINLNAKVYVSKKQGKEISSYILTTFKAKFSGHSIAVLGDWVKTKDYEVTYTAKNYLHVIYKFAQEKNKK